MKMKRSSSPISFVVDRSDRRRGSLFERSADVWVREAEGCARPHVAVLRSRPFAQFEKAMDANLREWVDLVNFDLLDHPFQADLIADSFAHAMSRASGKIGFYVNLFFQAACGWGPLNTGLLSELREFDIVHTSETFRPFSWQALQAKRASGCKLVTTVRERHSSASKRFKTMRDMSSAVLKEADLHITLTESRRQQLLCEGAKPAQVKVIPTGVDVGRFTPSGGDGGVRARLGIADDEFVILGVADPRRRQDAQDLVRAVARLSKDPACSSQRVRLVLISPRSMRKALKRSAQRAGIQGALTVTNFEEEDRALVYRAADVFAWTGAVQSSWGESSPYVLPEVLATGLPVLATESAPVSEVLGDAGILLASSDGVALSEGFKPLLLDANCREQMSAAGRQLAETRHDARLVARQLAAEYERLLKS
ncbi:MAG: glycosyltransferase family 4 protein [Planctomycetota bacterium]|nr:glycosyltransferase family 4 protein [Planctomycetota bacterium]